MDFNSGKPIVKCSVFHDVELRCRASVSSIDHPIFGKDYLSTSTVISILTTDKGVEAFETLNTIYVLDTYTVIK